MNVIKNPISGRDKLIVTDNVVFDAITGRQVGIIENGVVKSMTTGTAIATISKGSGGADVTLGVIDKDGNFQALAFNGVDATPSGAPEKVDVFYTWNNNSTTLTQVPVITGTQFEAMEFDLAPYVQTFYGNPKISATELPSGLTISGGLIKGTPMVYGTFLVNVIVSAESAAEKSMQIQLELAKGSVALPDPVFSAPLTASSSTAATGQGLTQNGTVTFVEFEGKQCAKIQGTGNYIAVNEPLSVNNKFTLALSIRGIDFGYITLSGGGYEGITSSINELWMNHRGDGKLDFSCGSSGFLEASHAGWTHLTAVWDGSKLSMYINGVFSGSQSKSCDFRDGLYLYINSLERAPEAVEGNGCYADVVLFNDVLSDVQIAGLYSSTL